MKNFMDKDFLLKTETAKHLYHNYAAKLPIIDYHCHINPKDIAENKEYDNIFQVWLAGDHYKWRAIRSNGVAEEYITGDRDPRDKFQKWAETLPRAIGNPLYHWTHLELKKYFGFENQLTGETAEEVWNLCNDKLTSGKMKARDIIKMSNVVGLCTTDDPCDSLEYHMQIAKDNSFDVKVLPAFRPDKAINIDKDGFVDYVANLSKAANAPITNLAELLSVLEGRVQFFHDNGCVTSDHGLDYVPYVEMDTAEIDKAFKAVLAGETISPKEADAFKTAVLIFLGKEYAKRGWIMQIHYGVLRNNNTKQFKTLGADTGYDCIGTFACADNIVRVFDALEKENLLPKSVLYSINPSDNEMLATILGCFQSDECKGKIQHGSAWWFNDTKTGMEKQLTDLANLSVLGNFIGMLTDSRSFLSYTRHEYFRRILCNLVGQWVEDGEYPNDEAMLKEIIEGICYYNTKSYFGF